MPFLLAFSRTKPQNYTSLPPSYVNTWQPNSVSHNRYSTPNTPIAITNTQTISRRDNTRRPYIAENSRDRNRLSNSSQRVIRRYSDRSYTGQSGTRKIPLDRDEHLDASGSRTGHSLAVQQEQQNYHPLALLIAHLLTTLFFWLKNLLAFSFALISSMTQHIRSTFTSTSLDFLYKGPSSTNPEEYLKVISAVLSALSCAVFLVVGSLQPVRVGWRFLEPLTGGRGDACVAALLALGIVIRV